MLFYNEKVRQLASLFLLLLSEALPVWPLWQRLLVVGRTQRPDRLLLVAAAYYFR
jgi:hypothetical protein